MVSFNLFYGAVSLHESIGWFYKHHVSRLGRLRRLSHRRMSLVHRLVNWQVSKIIANESSRVGRRIRPPRRRQVIGPYSSPAQTLDTHSPSTTAPAANNETSRQRCCPCPCPCLPSQHSVPRKPHHLHPVQRTPPTVQQCSPLIPRQRVKLTRCPSRKSFRMARSVKRGFSRRGRNLVGKPRTMFRRR